MSQEMKDYFSGFKYSEITEEYPDKEKYPLYYTASRHEFTIRAGEKLFIPAGWFHFVFSEDPDEKTGLNFAINFWYQPVNKWKYGDDSYGVPYVRKHDLQVTPEEIFGNGEVRVVRSELNGLFPSDRNFNWFPRDSVYFEWMGYQDFYRSKNPKYYIIQTSNDLLLNKKAFKYDTDLYSSSCWINFGRARSQLHFDEHDNWLCQMQGTKRVILFPHHERDLLYMKNPLPLRIYRQLIEFFEFPHQFIGYTRGVSAHRGNIHEVYFEQCSKYHEHKLVPNHVQLPAYPFPKKFQEIYTNHQNYNDNQPYPLNFFYIKEGKGTFHLHVHGGPLNVNPGDCVVFPSNFLFPFELKGNLKMIIPV